MKLLLYIYKAYAFRLRTLPYICTRFSSTIAGWKVFYLFGYRKKVIKKNLEKALPELNKQDLNKIYRLFARNFSDIFHEIVKYTSYSKEKVLEKVYFENGDIIKELTNKGANVMILAGHFGNWELLGATLPLITQCKTYGAAKIQRDSGFNNVINGLRQTYGLQILPSQHLYRSLLKQRHSPFAVYVLADQSPAKHEVEQFISFMGIDTPVYTGMGRIAEAMDLAVVFAAMKRVSRGKYRVEFKTIAENGKALGATKIAEEYSKLLEALIKEQPESWLWSHKRWKHSRDF